MNKVEVFQLDFYNLFKNKVKLQEHEPECKNMI